MKRLFISMFVLVSSVVCVHQANADEIIGAEFATMASCLSGIKKHSKQSLKIMTDKPDNVSGFLANGKNFRCHKVVTGSGNAYYRGWYMID